MIRKGPHVWQGSNDRFQKNGTEAIFFGNLGEIPLDDFVKSSARKKSN